MMCVLHFAACARGAITVCISLSSGIEAFADKILSWSAAARAAYIPRIPPHPPTSRSRRFPHYYTLKTMALLWLQVHLMIARVGVLAFLMVIVFKRKLSPALQLAHSLHQSF